MADELKPCPFCGGRGKVSFKDYKFIGKNYYGDKKISYRVQIICNKCKSRGKPIITGPLVNPHPYSSNGVIIITKNLNGVKRQLKCLTRLLKKQ